MFEIQRWKINNLVKIINFLKMPEKNIVIDNGSGNIKAGLVGENKPSIVFPSIVVVPKHEKIVG